MRPALDHWKLILGCIVLAISSAAAAAKQEAPSIASVSARPVTSPIVSPDRRVTFRLVAPHAREVVLTGEFMQGSQSLQMDAHGLWTITIGPIEPEIYYYNFTIDGVRTIDPGNADLKTGSTFSTLASVLEVRSERPAFYDAQPVPHGEIRTLWYQSKSLGALRRLNVYVPPRYDVSSGQPRRYPVLYLLHGANADETAWHRLGRVNMILDNLLATGKIQPFLVVMPFGYGVPPGAPAQPGENTLRFAKDLLEDVIPFVESRFHVSAAREMRALVGLSMGGGQALTIGLNHLELFSHVGGFSSGLGAVSDFPKTYASLVAQPEAASKKLRLLWVGCGNEDGACSVSQRFSEFLTANRIPHIFRATAGAHTWMVWRRYLHEVAPLLFQR